MTAITLKNLKHSEFASHETHCFEATVYVDGKRAFIASNQGFGGANEYHPIGKQTYQQMMKAVSDAETNLKNNCPKCGGDGMTSRVHNGDLEPCFECVLECHIFELINIELAKKDLKRLLKKKVAFTEGEGVFTVGYKGRPVDQDLIEHVKKEYPDAVILNCLAFDEALDFYRDCAA